MGFLGVVINPIAQIIDKILPDKSANDAAKAELLRMQIQGEIATIVGQIDVNKQEAASNSVFVAGWRPAVGWACACAFFYAFILQPLLQFVLVACKVNLDITKLPVLDMTDMMPVLLGMLGLGAMRSFDKAKGTDNGH